MYDMPEYNGVAERLNRTLMEKVRMMLHESGLPKFLWGEALKYAVYVKNCTWTQALKNMTPYEVLTGMKPDILNLRIWGQKVWVHDDKGTKLDDRAKEGYWVEIDNESKAHRIYWPGKRSVIVERSVRFTPEEVYVLLEGEDMDFEEQEELGEEDKRPVSPKPVEEQPVRGTPSASASASASASCLPSTPAPGSPLAPTAPDLPSLPIRPPPMPRWRAT